MAKYEHDCDKCVFLATAEIDGHESDLYVCGGGSHLTIVLRFGHLTSSVRTYPVALASFIPRDPALKQALTLAEQKEILSTTKKRQEEIDGRAIATVQRVLDHKEQSSEKEVTKAIEILEVGLSLDLNRELTERYGDLVMQLAWLKIWRSDQQNIRKSPRNGEADANGG